MGLRLRMLQKVELKMLEAFISICQKHHIRYFLLGGSALGAVRHSGFIPWDDDIDVGIPRRDYDKFLSIAQKELGEDLFLQTHQTDPSYPFEFAKIRDCRTAFIQSDVSHLKMNHGVFIDIFPLDGCPSGKIQKPLYALFFKAYRSAILYKHGLKSKKLAIRFSSAIFASFFSLPRLRKKIEQLMREYAYEDSEIIVNWCGAWGLKEAVPKQFFDTGCCMKFEDTTVTIPVDYDGYLKSLYGDYMVLPPVEKRVGHHFTDVVDLESSYTKYIKK